MSETLHPKENVPKYNCVPMNAVQEMIEKNGGLEGLKAQYLKIRIGDSFMPLVIELVTENGPRGYPVISVAHYYQQNGDMMRDPEIEFEILQEGYSPISYLQDPYRADQIVWKNEEGKVLVNVRKMVEVTSFARIWNRNLIEQGFLKAFQMNPTLYQISIG